jgi:hypothetical protein
VSKQQSGRTPVSEEGAGSFRFPSTGAAPEASALALHEPFAHPPLVLGEQYAPELSEPIGRRLVERPQHRLAIGNGQREHFRLEEERVLERVGDVIHLTRSEEFGEFPNVVVGDGNAGELHGEERIRTCVRGSGLP